ncbi:uncharacterized protein METZ01_LOCUS367278, partial [marine metagenome]
MDGIDSPERNDIESDVERFNMMHPKETSRLPYVTSCVVEASDYVKALPSAISSWFPRPLILRVQAVSEEAEGDAKNEYRSGQAEPNSL